MAVITNKTQPLWSYQEAAAFLGLKLGTLYGMVSQRRVPHSQTESSGQKRELMGPKWDQNDDGESACEG